MKKAAKLLRNEEGSIMAVVIIIMALLLLMGITATNMSTVELQILRNTIIQKQDFYATEGGVVELSADVDFSNLPGRLDPGRNSFSENYNITDINTPVILTKTIFDSTPPYKYENPSPTEIAEVKDTTWLSNYGGSDDEYAYRVFYRGQGPMPKGYGAGFGSYIFDLTARKQSGPTLTSMTAIINEGFRKIGPKN